MGALMTAAAVRRTIAKYSEATCREAWELHSRGEGGRTVGFYLGLTTRQADAAINAGRALSQDETTLAAATGYAERAADEYRLPQTVFRDADSCGWWHTNPFATRLQRAKLHVTILPRNYFD